MSHRLTTFLAAALIAAAPTFAADQTPPPTDAGVAPTTGMPTNCPMHAQHIAAAAAAKKPATASGAAHDHLAGVNARGEQGMGFSQTATTHHFLFRADGGEIRVEANDPKDITSQDQIRRHLFEIARSFSAGEFRTPVFVHDQVPPGVPVLERMRDAVNYSYADTDRGGRVFLSTRNAEALKAIQDFIRFQVQQHQTGDPVQPAS